MWIDYAAGGYYDFYKRVLGLGPNYVDDVVRIELVCSKADHCNKEFDVFHLTTNTNNKLYEAV